MNIQEDLKKVLLAGVGAVAVTAEKSKELIEHLVAKGELTVEQGKVLNEELKHNLNQTFTESKEKYAETKAKVRTERIKEQVEAMSAEELAVLKEKLAEMENHSDEPEEKAEEDEA